MIGAFTPEDIWRASWAPDEGTLGLLEVLPDYRRQGWPGCCNPI